MPVMIRKSVFAPRKSERKKLNSTCGFMRCGCIGDDPYLRYHPIKTKRLQREKAAL